MGKKVSEMTPEDRARYKAYDKARNATQERKASQRARDATPARKASRKAWRESPEGKAYKVRARNKARNATPEVKAYKGEYHRQWRAENADHMRLYHFIWHLEQQAKQSAGDENGSQT